MNPVVAPPRFARLSGTVVAFDDAAGYGTIGCAEETEVFFHCTRIADGTRTIRVGVRVEADCAPIGPGSWEAVDVRVVNPDEHLRHSRARP